MPESAPLPVRLGEADRAAITDHFLALDAEDRRLRFGQYAQAYTQVRLGNADTAEVSHNSADARYGRYRREGENDPAVTRDNERHDTCRRDNQQPQRVHDNSGPQ